MVVLFLVPYLGLSGALDSLTPTIATSLHTSEQTLGIGYGLANAGYALGTVLAVQLAQHLPQRRLTVVYAALLVIGSVLAAAANGPAMFIVGHVLQGLCTSLLLIASTPPLILGYPVKKLRLTAVIFNLCIFGAVAAGPLIGGAQASFHAWRPLFWIVAGVAFLGLVFALLTFSDAPPADLSAPRDPVAIGLAAAGSVLAFFGAAQLLTHGFFDPVAVVPLLVGIALIVTLVVYEYHARHPLLILRALTTTIPVTGVIIAMCAAAAATSAIALTATVQTDALHAAAPGTAVHPRAGRGRGHRDRVRADIQHALHSLLRPVRVGGPGGRDPGPARRRPRELRRSPWSARRWSGSASAPRSCRPCSWPGTRCARPPSSACSRSWSCSGRSPRSW